ncbi:copper fist DNA-binding domain-containing protein [Aspergillus lucknowensis]|uniref:Copper fist DNA binding domain-containing protein n=1 Tax=Aspergillus lucknowensis TaxID=176173 RepID=A0ABR4L5V8_9EURO
MPFDEEGNKWSCDPCLRGHRSSKCQHFDRLMARVPKSGRPSKKCPHSKRHCSCRKSYAVMSRLSDDANSLCRLAYYVTNDSDEPTSTPDDSHPATPVGNSQDNTIHQGDFCVQSRYISSTSDLPPHTPELPVDDPSLCQLSGVLDINPPVEYQTHAHSGHLRTDTDLAAEGLGINYDVRDDNIISIYDSRDYGMLIGSREQIHTSSIPVGVEAHSHCLTMASDGWPLGFAAMF